MKRRRHLSILWEYGCVPLREGDMHSFWTNPANGDVAQMPRHAEIVDVLTRKICRDLGIPEP